ncbi:8906_t:CDS:2, partial [Dentiscutata erythropus]
QGYSVLSVACWVTEPLDKLLIEKLSDLFDNIVEDDQVIQVISIAKADEGKNYQSFEINALIKANIDNVINNKSALNFSIELIACGASEMLNKKCQSLQNWFIGFYLESIIIEVSPLSDTSNSTNSNSNNSANNTLASFILKNEYSPLRIGPERYEASTGHTTNSNFQLNLSSQSIGASVSRNLTYSDSTKATICEWEMRVVSDPIKGVIWPYKNINDKIDQRMCPERQPHSGK